MATETMTFEGYEYGLRGQDGEIVAMGDIDMLRKIRRPDELIMMRAMYTAGWFAFIEAAE